ncbi:site-2 protease family protein [Patescibacteria group bacterium]|nr:site-2 protease family protein [Patescibacteria group bacterium]
MFTFLSYLFVVIGLSVLVLVHEAGHFLAAKAYGIFVEEFGFGLPPRITGRRFGETLVSINWLPFGGFVRLFGEQPAHEGEAVSKVPPARSFSEQSVGKRTMVIAAGVAMNFLLGWFLLSAVFMVGIPQTLTVTDIQQGSAAQRAGIQKGDQLLGFPTIADLTAFLEQRGGMTVPLRIVRNNVEQTVSAVLPIPPAGTDVHLGVYLVESGVPQLSVGESITRGLSDAWEISIGIVTALGALIMGFFGHGAAVGGFVGPVGIVTVAAQTARQGIVYFMQLLALLSLNLAVFNIIPFPALDGGRLAFLVFERLTGRKANERLEAAFNTIGFAILLLLIAIVTAHDILRLL